VAGSGIIIEGHGPTEVPREGDGTNVTGLLGVGVTSGNTTAAQTQHLEESDPASEELIYNSEEGGSPGQRSISSIATGNKTRGFLEGTTANVLVKEGTHRRGENRKTRPRFDQPRGIESYFMRKQRGDIMTRRVRADSIEEATQVRHHDAEATPPANRSGVGTPLTLSKGLTQ